MTKVGRFIFSHLFEEHQAVTGGPVVFHVNEFAIDLSTKIIKAFVSYFVKKLNLTFCKRQAN